MKKLRRLKNRLVTEVGVLLLKGGGVNMVDVYVALIIYGLRTLDSIPEQQYDAVEEALKVLKLDGNGKPLQQ